MFSPSQSPSELRGTPLYIAVISRDRQHRITASSALARCGNVRTQEIEPSAVTLEESKRLFGHPFDGILIDLDGDPRPALALVEGLCIDSSLTAMAFSSRPDPELILQAMRAGAREFFTLPFDQGAIASALDWIATQRAPKQANGRLHIFLGSKGGVGVTTVACNFAVALATQSKQNTLLIDLNLLLGDAALNLGIDAPHSVADALQNASRINPEPLDTFLARHSSGLFVLPAPAQMPQSLPSGDEIGRLLAVAGQQFDNVVIDAGKKIDIRQVNLVAPIATAYVVTQVGIPELRNANRLIAQFSGDDCPKLQIVINRYQSRFLGLTDEHLNQALTRPIQWKIPNDFKAVSTMQSTGTALVDHDTPIAAVLRQMAQAASGSPASAPDKPARRLAAFEFRLPWRAAARALHPDETFAESVQMH